MNEMERTLEAQRRFLADILEKLVGDLYDAVGVRVSFYGAEGTRLAQTEYQCDFCRSSMQEPALKERCFRCAARAIELASEKDSVFFYRCWRGLMSAVLQVKVDEQVLGSFILSGYVCSQDRMEQTEQLFPAPDMQISEEERKTIQFMEDDHVHDIIHTVSIAARYLSEAYQRQAAEDAQRKAEFRALQSQISPHFLFNTLNSISQMAVLEGAEKTPEAIYSLAVLLRRTMKQNLGRVPLREELSFVREYIHINQLLGYDDIRYEEEIEPGLEEFLVPAFTVQPLVENAVRHGLKPTGRGGTVSVTAYRGDGSLIISVTDDGQGFEPWREETRRSGDVSGIGITNVIERLRMYYGSEACHEAVSAPGEGATITLRIPME